MLYKLLTLIFVFLLCTVSCDFDQIESRYENYKSAQQENLFSRGWIPNELVSESMTEIYVRSNVDINSCFFSYKLSDTDLNKVKKKLQLINPITPNPRRLKIPKQFEKQIKNLNQYFLLKKDTVYVRIDEKRNHIFGWY